MQITLVEEEIRLAIENYVREQINISDNQNLHIDLRATRGEAGITAMLEITSKKVEAAKPVTRSGPKAVTTEKVEEAAPEPVKTAKEPEPKAINEPAKEEVKEEPAEETSEDEAPKPARSIFSKVAS